MVSRGEIAGSPFVKTLLLVLLLCPVIHAAEPTATPPDTAIYTVSHVDFLPSGLKAVSFLDAYVAQEQHDPDVVHAELLQSIEAPNHFTLIETFRNRDSYNRHLEAGYTRNFRAGIAAALGSPYDERLFHLHPVQ